MTFVDIENLFEYLKIHYEHNPKVNSKREKNAWFELLEPFDPADVKAAMLQCLREKPYLPHAQEVAVKCAITAPGTTQKPANKEQEQTMEQVAWMRDFLAKRKGGDEHG